MAKKTTKENVATGSRKLAAAPAAGILKVGKTKKAQKTVPRALASRGTTGASKTHSNTGYAG